MSSRASSSSSSSSQVFKHLPKFPTEYKRKLSSTAHDTAMKKPKVTTVCHCTNVLVEYCTYFDIDKDDSSLFDEGDSNGASSKGISSTSVHGASTPSTSTSSSSHQHHQTAIDITAADLIGKLSIGNVVDLVLVSMFLLPEKMPASFQATYTPIAAAGTPAQIEHLARLLGAQLTAAGYGKGYELMRSQQVKSKHEKVTSILC
jgi:hypothetical protein